jgi:hypothetical protein
MSSGEKPITRPYRRPTLWMRARRRITASLTGNTVPARSRASTIFQVVSERVDIRLPVERRPAKPPSVKRGFAKFAKTAARQNRKSGIGFR